VRYLQILTVNIPAKNENSILGLRKNKEEIYC